MSTVTDPLDVPRISRVWAYTWETTKRDAASLTLRGLLIIAIPMAVGVVVFPLALFVSVLTTEDQRAIFALPIAMLSGIVGGVVTSVVLAVIIRDIRSREHDRFGTPEFWPLVTHLTLFLVPLQVVLSCLQVLPFLAQFTVALLLLPAGLLFIHTTGGIAHGMSAASAVVTSATLSARRGGFTVLVALCMLGLNLAAAMFCYLLAPITIPMGVLLLMAAWREGVATTALGLHWRRRPPPGSCAGRSV